MLNVTELSRLQFALTAMYHFLFVPLTLGLSFLLAIMETIYLISGNVLFKDMTKFWGKFFIVNFALGILTGLTLEFQFGTNWSYFSHYVGDIFGIPLAIEGLVAFFLESTFVGLFIFGWHKLSKIQHVFVTWLVALGSNLSALWILLANSWMQNPISFFFNYKTTRLEMLNFFNLIYNRFSQVKFFHTILSGYCTSVIFVIGICSYFFLKKRNYNFFRASFIVAVSFGIPVILGLIFLGDESGYQLNKFQKTKLAAIESIWRTEKAPASFLLFAIPNQIQQCNKYSIRIPYLLGVLATRSFNNKITGMKDLMISNRYRILNGINVYSLFKRIKSGTLSSRVIKNFYDNYFDLGYGLLLNKYINNIEKSTFFHIDKAVKDSIPFVLPLYFAFRVMILCGIIILLLLIISFVSVLFKWIGKSKILNYIVLYCMPFPWIATECGWFISEYGRQPWAIVGVLPTNMAHSFLDRKSILFSLFLICSLYTFFLVIEVFLMCKIIRIGPRITKKKNFKKNI